MTLLSVTEVGANTAFRDNRQIRKIPARIAAVVGVWLRLLKQVTDTLGHHLTITALDKAIAFPVRFGQDISNGARQTRFFGNKQPH